MTPIERVASVLWMVLVVICCVVSSDVDIYRDNKLLTDEEKRGATDVSFKDFGGKSKTSKRGITSTRDHKRSFGLGALSPSGHGDYDSGRYGGSGSGFSQTASGGYVEDDRLPPIYESGGGSYHHSGGGYSSGRPSGYGANYGPPRPYQRPGYPGDYDDNYYSGHSGNGGGNEQGMGGYKMQTLKKLLLPLAGLAILGVAAAASQNSVLLPLGSNIYVHHLTCYGSHGISISVGFSNDSIEQNTLSDVLIEDALIFEAMSGIHIKTHIDAGVGLIRNVTYRNIGIIGSYSYGICIEQNYTNRAVPNTGAPPLSNIPIVKLNFFNVFGAVKAAALPYYVICAKGACSDWNWNFVHIFGQRVSVCVNYHPNDVSCMDYTV
ncbi:hypothetical protein HUJ05_000145 [Dendroctonus ponderosae]|nr:hypothetical protein HUJ05_000145 [Dendroctonus ponderosae]